MSHFFSLLNSIQIESNDLTFIKNVYLGIAQ